MESGNVTRLLREIQENTTKYLTYLETQQIPEPDFLNGDNLDPAKPLPNEITTIKDAALESTIELHNLLLGPLGLLLNSPGEQYLLLSLQYIYKYKIADLLPEKGEISFAQVASERGLEVSDITRFLRVSIAYHVFNEPRIGYLAHTAASRLLVKNVMLEAWIMNIAQEFWPSLTRMVEATEKWPGSEEPNESGYSIANHTDENPFDMIKNDSQRQQQFIDAMSYSHLHSSYNMCHLIDNFDFGAVENGTIVDVGGSHGQVSIAIARRFPGIKCIVQDLPDTICGLESQIPRELKNQISGMDYDFLTPQPVKAADVYLFRWILHDWSDKYCVKILQSLVPALKHGAKIVINDICIPQPGQLSISADRSLRLMDISMKAFNNARERDPEIWTALFSRADPRFHLMGIHIPPEARMAIIVAEWSEQ